MREVIYLDHHSTTPLDPRVLEAMMPYLTEHFGNPSSRQHQYGWIASRAVERARQQVADLIGAHESEVVFTSGATESNHLAILGLLQARGFEGSHLITTAIEHSSVLEPLREAVRRGAQLTVLPVSRAGLVNPDDLRRALRPNTVLASVMTANNEIGTLQPVAEIGRICRALGVAFHSDAAQAAGRISLNVDEAGLDLVSMSAHKNYGPKGVGALFVRKREPRVALKPLFLGGGQEGGLRSGTLNVPGVVGMGEACAISKVEWKQEAERVRALRDRLWSRLNERISELRLHGSLEQRLPGNLCFEIAGVSAASLMMEIKRIAVSSGAACASDAAEPSHVLKAIGCADESAHASLRLCVGRMTTALEIDESVDLLVGRIKTLRHFM